MYVGKSFGRKRINVRGKEHFRYLKGNKHPNKILQTLYHIYPHGFKLEVVEHFSSITDDELCNKEIYYVKYFNTYEAGANSTIGGRTVTGLIHKEETKKMLSMNITGSLNHFYGKKHSELSKYKMSLSRKGRPVTAKQLECLSIQWRKPKSKQHKENISKALKGREFSKETREKMSQSAKGRKWTEESKLKRHNTIRKLSDEELFEIYQKANSGNFTNKQLSIEYGVGMTLISNIKNLRAEYIKNIIEDKLITNKRG